VWKTPLLSERQPLVTRFTQRNYTVYRVESLEVVAEPGLRYEVASPASHQGEACEAGTTFASRKRAILAVLRWVQSKREYENIMQHLSTTIGEKGDWKANEARVIAFLAEGEQPREYGYDAGFISGAQKVIITPSHYAENLHAIYTHLPDAPAVSPGHPNEFMLPLTPVSPSFLHSCTTYITTQHGR